MDFTSSSAFSSLFSLLSVILFLHHFPCCFKKYRQASLSQTFCKSILLWDFNISYVMINLFWWACYEIGQHCHLFFRKLFFLLFGSFYKCLGGQKNQYFTSNLWIVNPLGDFKDIKTSAKSVGRTHHIKFSDPINSA